MNELYSYNEIEQKFTIISTVGDYINGVIVGYNDGYYYEFNRYYKNMMYSKTYYDNLSFNNKKIYDNTYRFNREFIRVKVTKHYNNKNIKI